MRIVPVMDVRGGRVVHAGGGDRAGYPPLSRRFPVPDDPGGLAGWIRDRWGERLLYLADLDALAGGQPGLDLVEELAAAGHALRVDAAVTGADRARALLDAGAREVVVALETLASWDGLREVADAAGSRRTVLSLDLRAGRPAGGPAPREREPRALARRAVEAGAGRLLLVELERVGSRRGPDVGLLRRCRSAAPGVGLTAAGGVRGATDVEAVSVAGGDECMVATALYGGELTPPEVRRLEGGDRPGPAGKGEGPSAGDGGTGPGPG